MSQKRRRSVAQFILGSVLGLASVAWPLAAQTAGSISGTIRDPQGAVIPNAKVTLTNREQGASSARQVESGAEGTFVFTPLQAGSYSVTVEAPSFKKYTQSGITLDVNERLGLPPISLEIGTTDPHHGVRMYV